VTTNFSGGSGEEAHAVAVQGDGKIVAVGASNGDFAVARYNPDGTLDTGFGTGGIVTTDFEGGDDVAHAVAVQGDGRIVVTGSEVTPPINAPNFALARYNSDGTLDTTFGPGGKVTTDFGTIDEAHAVAIQDDGKIVAAGWAGSDPLGLFDFGLARYSQDGSPDPT
jgi:uncharacterized delta-60 repeat protein